MPKSKLAVCPPLLAALSALIIHPQGAAQSAGGGASATRGDAADIENIVVTASRIGELPAETVGASVTVIPRAELEIRQATFVADALRDAPGLAVSRGGGYGAVTQLRIRGTEGNHALVLIDGVEANNPVANSEFDFANLLVGDIERIEVLRGPQSALYGSDAVGGVINVITREHDDGLDARFAVEGGNLGTRAGRLSVNGGNERRGGGLHAARLRTDGHNIARSGDEKDGFENESLSLHGRTRVGERFAVRANLHYIDSTQEFDSQDFSMPPTPTQGLVVDDDVWSGIEQWFGRVEARAELPRTAHRIGVGVTQTDNRFFEAGAPTGRNEGEKTRLDYQVTLDLAGSAESPHALTVALERELVDYANYGASADSPENQVQDDAQTSVVAEYRRAFSRAAFSASARFDENSLFEDAATWRLTGSYAIDERTRLHTSAGTGVANPGFFELFGAFPGSFVGNPELKPEHSTSFDVGIERRFAGATLDLTYFRADLEDEIQTTFDDQTFLSTVHNLPGRSTRRGAELSVSAEPLPRWSVDASYTYTDAEQSDGAAELRRPAHVASLDNTLSFLEGRAHLHVGIDHTGAQLDNEFIFATPEERVELPAFTLVDVAGELRPSPRLRVYARVENLLDEEYEEWFSYRGRSRAYVAGFDVSLPR